MVFSLESKYLASEGPLVLLTRLFQMRCSAFRSPATIALVEVSSRISRSTVERVEPGLL